MLVGDDPGRCLVGPHGPHLRQPLLETGPQLFDDVTRLEGASCRHPSFHMPAEVAADMRTVDRQRRWGFAEQLVLHRGQVGHDVLDRPTRQVGGSAPVVGLELVGHRQQAAHGLLERVDVTLDLHDVRG